MTAAAKDAELAAIMVCCKTLQALDGDASHRVLEFLTKRFDWDPSHKTYMTLLTERLAEIQKASDELRAEKSR